MGMLLVYVVGVSLIVIQIICQQHTNTATNGSRILHYRCCYNVIKKRDCISKCKQEYTCINQSIYMENKYLTGVPGKHYN